MSPKLELRSQMMTSSCTILKESYISECANLAVADPVGWEVGVLEVGVDSSLSIWGNIMRQVRILRLSNCIYVRVGVWVVVPHPNPGLFWIVQTAP